MSYKQKLNNDYEFKSVEGVEANILPDVTNAKPLERNQRVNAGIVEVYSEDTGWQPVANTGLPTGLEVQYFKGDKTLGDFADDVAELVDPLLADKVDNTVFLETVADIDADKEDNLPSVLGQNGKILSNNGAIKIWVDPGAASLPDIITPGAVGSASKIPVFEYDEKGRVISVTDVDAAGGDDVLPIGAVGDGVTNDQASLNAWLSAGSKLYLPQGTYLINTACISSITRTDLSIRFHPKAKIIAAAGYPATGGGMLQISGTENIVIDAPTLEGNSDNATTLNPDSNNGTAILITGAVNVTVKNGSFKKQQKSAVRTVDCDYVTIIDNEVETENFAFDINTALTANAHRNKITGNGTAQMAASGGSVLAGAGVQTTAIFFKDCGRALTSYNEITDYRGTAIKSEGCGENLHEKNTITIFGKDGIKVQGSAVNPTVTNASILNNHIFNRRHWHTDGSAYIVLSNLENFDVRGNTIIGDGMSTHPGFEAGIHLQSNYSGFTTRNGIVQAGLIQNMGSYGIYSEPRLSNVTFDSVLIRNFSTILTTGYGIFLESGSDNIDIINPNITNDVLPTTTGSHAMNITGGNIRIKGGLIRNIRGEGIRFKPTNSEAIDISGISIDNTNSVAIYIVYLSGAVVSTVSNLKINNNIFTRNCLADSLSAVVVYTGNVAEDLNITQLQLANNNISKGGASATTYLITFYNDGFGSVARFDYRGNVLAPGIGGPNYLFTPDVITTDATGGGGTGVITEDDLL